MAAHALTRTAMIRAFRELRKLFTKAEWLKPLIDEALAALAVIGDDEAAAVDHDVRVMSSVTSAQDIIDANDEDAALPAEVVNFEQARSRLRDNAALAAIKYLLARTGDQYRRVHIWDGRNTLCGKWSAAELELRQHEFEMCDAPPEGREICGRCRISAALSPLAGFLPGPDRREADAPIPAA